MQTRACQNRRRNELAATYALLLRLVIVADETSYYVKENNHIQPAHMWTAAATVLLCRCSACLGRFLRSLIHVCAVCVFARHTEKERISKINIVEGIFRRGRRA